MAPKKGLQWKQYLPQSYDEEEGADLHVAQVPVSQESSRYILVMMRCHFSKS